LPWTRSTLSETGRISPGEGTTAIGYPFAAWSMISVSPTPPLVFVYVTDQ
jgi:hypothetical protein